MAEPNTSVRPEPGRRRARIAFIIAVIAVLAIPLMSVGRYLGFWTPVNAIPSLLSFVITFLAAIVAVILGLIGVLRRKGCPWSAYPVQRSAFALGLGVIMLLAIGLFAAEAGRYPPIHDITTDTGNPPEFVALRAERDAMQAPNDAEYDPAVAAQQRQGFPDLAPKVLPLTADEAFNKSLKAAADMGWRIAATEPSEGRIEAVATTFWSGYLDDVVIRITASGDGQSRIDVRSKSRVGGGDAGANGKRIEKFLAMLD
ncbi:MAG: DUF1499 domain-containing protein [Pseudohongiellaceae bacterium]